MKFFCVPQALCLKGEVALLGDKSIAHRCIIVSAIAKGKTVIENFPANQDCLFTISAFKKLGIKIRQAPRKGDAASVITVFGKGLYGLEKPPQPIFVGDSGTTLRLLPGVLAAQSFEVTLKAASSLSRRPMLRVTGPLRMMGAAISARCLKGSAGHEEYPPLTISGGALRPITYQMPVASAQVKSAILLAGLYADGATEVIEPIATRDHTERILKLFKAEIQVKKNTIVIRGGRQLLSPGKIYLPADISSASFFIVAATILPNSRVCIKKASLNPSRTGIIRVLKRMGADIKVTRSPGRQVARYEPMGDIIVKSSKLKGALIKKHEIPSLIDELPVLMVAACFAKGKTRLKGIGELRVKETDRIKSMSENLRKMGADIEVIGGRGAQDMVIRGVEALKGARVKSFGDHRTAMSMVVAGLGAKGKTAIDDISCVNKSFPGFGHILSKLIVR